MADPNWRTNSDIQLAKQVCQHKQAAAAIVIWFEPTGAFGISSYGKDGRICKETGKLVDALYDQLNTGNLYDNWESLYGAISQTVDR